MPKANDLAVGFMSLAAEQEREAISRRTREALVAAKARGIRLGNPQNCVAALRRAGEGGVLLREAIARNADRHARDLRRVVEDIRTTGLTSLGAIADNRNTGGILTRRGGRWHKSTVTILLKRLEKARRDSPQRQDRALAEPHCARHWALTREIG